MPELPEVEVSRLGLLPYLPGKRISGVCLRTARLRHEIPADLPKILAGRTLLRIDRRAKYLIFVFTPGKPALATEGFLILHLGMSGSLRLVAPGTPAQKHDHVDLEFGDTTLRLRDPRRFGTLAWTESPAETHPLLATQGIEPLSDAFTGDWLFLATRRRSLPIKQLLMDSHTVVGVGNIYASESLFHAGISPLRPASRISRQRCARLTESVRKVLQASIAAGGSSVRDYVHSDGGAGCFQLQCAVYDRAGEPCIRCGKPLHSIRQGGRSTFYCSHCQT